MRLANIIHYNYNYSSFYSNINLQSTIHSFKFQDLSITRTTNEFCKPQFNKQLQFGVYPSDHLFQNKWNIEEGWGKPVIVPFHMLKIHPMCSCIHYASVGFEGMKAYKNEQNQIRIFRPDSYLYRLKLTALRLSLPDFDGEELLKCIKELIKVDKEWIPSEKGLSIYIKTVIAASEASLGVKVPRKAHIFTLLSPCGEYFRYQQSLKLLATNQIIRAAPGGVGQYKVSGNFGLLVEPLQQIQNMGFDSHLLYQKTGLIQGGDLFNIFFLWRNEQNEMELCTPNLDGTIIPGVIRDSILELTKNMNKLKVLTKDIYIQDIINIIKSGRMIEIFATGTAVNIKSITTIGYQGQLYSVDENSGFLAKQLTTTLSDIYYGINQHKWISSID